MQELLKKHADKLRFAIVGGANTALDFAILFALTAFGLDKIISNYISTTVAFVFSFFANRSFTFKATSGNARKQFIAFTVVTLFGLWVIQPIVILGFTAALASTGWDDALLLFIAKLVATIASLIWNYLFYAKFVFKMIEEDK